MDTIFSFVSPSCPFFFTTQVKQRRRVSCQMIFVDVFSPSQDRCSSECGDCCPNISVCEQCLRLAEICDCRLPTMRSCLSNSCPSSTVSKPLNPLLLLSKFSAHVPQIKSCLYEISVNLFQKCYQFIFSREVSVLIYFSLLVYCPSRAGRFSLPHLHVNT